MSEYTHKIDSGSFIRSAFDRSAILPRKMDLFSCQSGELNWTVLDGQLSAERLNNNAELTIA